MSSTPKVHKRAYQACIPCRERRVRCDLGSVDQPHQGPCGRCRRERKFCHFSATRGRKKGSSSSAAPAATVSTPDDPLLQEERGRRVPATDSPGIPSVHVVNDTVVTDAPPTPTIKADVPPTRARPKSPPSCGGDKTAATLLRDAAYTSHDALNLLFEAGRHSERVAGTYDLRRLVRAGTAPSDQGTRPSAPPSTQGSNGTSAILQVWSNLRFVRTGLITAEEALDLVNYFHAYLAPFTPISSTYFQDPSMHQKMLEDEPILAVTILTLASRYMKLSGPGGVSRSFMVHERLWQHLQGMISRMIFGQEQFTSAPTADISIEPRNALSSEYPLAGSSFGSLRTLGTCEALLLLSEWHPRSMHVPAGDDGDSIVVKEDVRRTRASTTGIGGRIRIDWLEPVWRSDRMCWSMLGNALALAVELGIFDEYDNTTIGARESRRDIWNSPASSERAYLVQHLLWVYLTQTSGRLGLSELRGENVKSADEIGWKNLTNVAMTGQDPSVKHGDTIRCWVGVASLMKRGNELLFPSRERTRDIVLNGEYLAILRMLNPLLKEWQRDFDQAKLSKPMRSILAVEFGYVRVYINSLALHAVVEYYNRLTDEGTAVPHTALLNPYPGNEEYFTDVVNSARAILQTVVEELLPDDRLKHIPLRTYSRILAGAMFCLKAYALGTKDSETAISLSLVERTADALRTCVVDDVHLSNRFGELLQALTQSLRSRVTTLPGADNTSGMVTPMRLAPHYPQHTYDPDGSHNGTMPPDVKPTIPESFERGPLTQGPLQPGMVHADYSNGGGYPASLAGSTTSDTAYMPMAGVLPDQHSFQQDPLISFAGLGPNQLGWSGGQDFFDMLGPLLDVQYEHYR